MRTTLLLLLLFALIVSLIVAQAQEVSTNAEAVPVPTPPKVEQKFVNRSCQATDTICMDKAIQACNAEGIYFNFNSVTVVGDYWVLNCTDASEEGAHARKLRR